MLGNNYGIAFVGGGFSKTKDQVKEDDIVVLKIGKTMKAAGKVVQRNGTHKGCGDKEWMKDFDGWDLSAYCYVDWKEPAKPTDDVSGRTRATIQGIND